MAQHRLLSLLNKHKQVPAFNLTTRPIRSIGINKNNKQTNKEILTPRHENVIEQENQSNINKKSYVFEENLPTIRINVIYDTGIAPQPR
jgi:hypothetical protein